MFNRSRGSDMALPSDAQARKHIPLATGLGNLRSTLRHGASRKGSWSPEYYSWASMIQRCTNPKRNNWHLYGGRGIEVCERWRLFDSFLADMGLRPEGFSLGRIDPDGDYEPSNCEWQSAKQQARSRRNNKLTEFKADAIRASTAGSTTVGRLYGVSKTMVQHIRAGREWAHG